ncbi:pentatricopeptide repeat-containing protein At4g18520, chloroplastic isoform X2 [Cicer arietinum]|uniref:Pentatricopeptide repeat-containing protein At4g18520, chloroplastic-like n=1 Tax=Cicer arietinum TaxID=3827 RepID=A0A1S2YJ85_CICAR|nr:pentatricopeptide repeat-containing protein At4g18520, chloroplastic-like [Cicer arietinum]
MELRIIPQSSCYSLPPNFLTLKPPPHLPFSLSSHFSYKTVDQEYQQHSFPIAACSCDASNSTGGDEKRDVNDHIGFLDNNQMIRDFNQLIEIFMVDDSQLTDWRRLLVFNKNWSDIRLHFFRHCQDRADSEDDMFMKNKLLLIGKKLKEIDEDIQKHSELNEMIKRAPSEISDIVSRSRKDFTEDFFAHLHTVTQSYNDNPKAQTAVKVYDTATESNEALNAAELNFQDIINSPLDASYQKVDNIAEKGQCLDPDSVAHWLRLCNDVEEVGRVHTIVLKRFRDSNTYVNNNLICSYLRLGKLAQARKVFDGMPRRDTVTWTAIIDGYLKFNLDDEAFKLFHGSVKHGVQPNSKMFVCFMNLCCKRVDLALGKQIHARILKSNWRNLIVDSAVVNFYSKCGKILSAFRTFDRMAKRDVICWTTMITACSQQGLGHEALLMLSQMLGDGFFPNEYTICAALKACGENKALKFGTQLHGAVIKKICKSDVFIGTSLIDMYAKCGEIANSKNVFDRMRVRNTATWTSIISGYARNGFGEEAVNFFRLMKRKKVYVNKLTLVCVMMACGTMKASLIGREVHAQKIKSLIHTNMYIESTLVWFYCRCKEYSKAFNVLKHMPFRDVVSWTAIISGCARLGLEAEALEFLREMMEEGVSPNSYTYSSALKACAKLEAPMQGKLIHSNASKTPALSNVFVNSALIYMYAKCGYIADAFQVFDNMPERNLVSWKAMILGYARNGHCRKALKLMYRMRAEGFVVDDYILATVLTACGGIDCGDIDWDLESSSHDLHPS